MTDKTPTSELIVAVVSDLHAYEPDRKKAAVGPSHLSIAAPEDEPSLHPIVGLLSSSTTTT